MENQINYHIPPLTPAEAFVYIKEGKYHVDAYCDSDYESSCQCLAIFFNILDGCPFDHDQPRLPPKKYEDMSEEEKRHHRLLQAWAASMMREMIESSIFSWDSSPFGKFTPAASSPEPTDR